MKPKREYAWEKNGLQGGRGIMSEYACWIYIFRHEINISVRVEAGLKNQSYSSTAYSHKPNTVVLRLVSCTPQLTKPFTHFFGTHVWKKIFVCPPERKRPPADQSESFCIFPCLSAEMPAFMRFHLKKSARFHSIDVFPHWQYETIYLCFHHLHLFGHIWMWGEVTAGWPIIRGGLDRQHLWLLNMGTGDAWEVTSLIRLLPTRCPNILFLLF